MTIDVRDITSWIGQNKGKYIDFDGYYGVQCYDLFNAYGKQFWNLTFFGFNDPGDYWYHASLPSGWSRIAGCKISDMHYGDIIMFGTPNSVPYGHVGIVTTPGKMVDENGMGHNDPVTERNISAVMGWTPAPYIGVLRPNIIQENGKTSGTQPLTPQQSFVKMMRSLHYKDTSIFAIMGSIQGESQFQPMIKEGGGNLDFKSAITQGWQGGWGLIQWTPPAKIKAYPEWNKVNLAETQADIIDDFYNPSRHKWSTDGAGASLAVINSYRSQSGWANVDWDEVINFNFEYNKFIVSDANIETKLAYFIVCCERPNFSDALKSYPVRLAAAKDYAGRDWSHLDGYNKADGNTSSDANTQDSIKQAIDPAELMILMQPRQ